MTVTEGLVHGLSVALSLQNLFAAFAGALAGTLIGVLPGLGPLGGIAIILPLTYSMDPVTGLIAMAGMYYGAMYGGSTTAILVNMPGEAAAAMTCIDGYQLTRKGRAGAALTIAAAGSFVGGTVATIGVLLFSPPLAQLGLLFGPAELFALVTGGLLVFTRISGGTFAAGFFPMAIGLALSTVGQEAVTAQQRFTFGWNELSPGVTLIALVVGLYGISEIMHLVATHDTQVKPVPVKLREMWPTREEWRRSGPSMGRGTLLGFVIGLLPGPHTTMSAFASYRLERAVAKHRAEMGKGAIEGVAGPETANNAAATSTLVPMLALGIPFGPITALMLTSMIVHGIQPGPLLMTQHAGVFWGLIVSMYVGNVMLLVLNIPMISLWVSLLRVPQYVFLPLIVMLATIGAYSVHNSMLDVWMLLPVGCVAYALNKLQFQLTPMVIGIVLGPLIEKHLREGLILSGGDPGIFLSTPIAVGTWIVVAALLVASWFGRARAQVGLEQASAS